MAECSHAYLCSQIKIVDGDPRRVMSFADFDEEGLRVRTTWLEKGVVLRYDALAQYAQLAAEGRFTIPVARTFGLGNWHEATELGMNKQAHGKLLLLPDQATTANT